ncbi:glycosyltransferase family 4 protein [Candidatus Amoebophilus asiaticus]|nr:glycosyltransferase family 4 protein [Candidatus Amoebophilus asiaticus]
MRIGIIIGRIGGVDGVALETEKWIEVLQKMGHEIFILSGQYEEREIDKEHETLFPVLSFFSTEAQWGQQKAFFNPENDPEPLLEHVEKVSDYIAHRIKLWIRGNNIDILLSENASALPSHLSMGVGIKKVVESTGMKTITHDHDFHWERGNRYISSHDKVNQLIEETFPLQIDGVKHAVINTHAVQTLKDKFGTDSYLVPNVMNFDIPFGETNEYNQTLLADLGYNNNSIPLFQITRVVHRKGIEVAIELIHKLNDDKIRLIITGNHNDDEGDKYYNSLLDKIEKFNLYDQIIFADNIIQNHAWRGIHGSKKYSLSDAYANAKACTYFSTYEGFGNAFVEAVLAKTPIFVNNYKPVYMPDIGSKGFKVVMLEDNKLTDKAIDEMKEIIYNDQLNKEVGDHNFELGKKYFSYDVLEEKFEDLLKF